MQKLAALVVTTILAGTSLAIAQTSPPVSPPVTASPPAMNAPAQDLVLSEDQAKAWIGKSVYSSDGTNLGEVAAFARDASGRVTEMHAAMGGFLGIGETRVRILPTQFTVGTDRIVVALTAEQAKALPPIPKK